MTEKAVETVRVALPGRAYDIRIGPGLIARAGAEMAQVLSRPRVFVLTDETVAGLHLAGFEASCRAAAIETKTLTLPAGEGTKSWAPFTQAVDWLLDQRIERRDVVVALGGGVIGDLAGFVAATALRGLGFVQVPTTLLAQVDSSVGGKTGINTKHGKNLAGAFYQPRLVLADIDVLDTLPRRDFLSGYAEVAKYGLLGDAAFFEWLEAAGPALRDGNSRARMRAVQRSCEMKAEIVLRDEKENGDRALLNLGHTFGHALEAATGYSQRLLHGEGVAIGCVLAFEASARMGLCAQELPSRVAAHFKTMGLPTSPGDIEGTLPGAEALIDLMGRDKKVMGGALAFILARGIGEAFLTREADLGVVRGVLDDALRELA